MAERRKNRRDQDLRDAVGLLSSARKEIVKTRFMPVDRELQKNLGDDLLKWVESEEADDIDDFFCEREIGAFNFYKACEGNAYLDECHEIALSKIGKRIKAKVKASHDYNMKVMPYYNAPMRKEKKDKIDADQNQVVTTIYKEEKIGIPVFGKNKK